MAINLLLSSVINSTYSLVSLFFLVLASSMVIIPEIELLVASFASFATSIHSLFFIIVLVLLASMLGDLATYFLARIFSERFRKYLRKFKWFSKDEEKTRLLLYKHGFLFIFLSRFLLTGFGLVLNYLSGFEEFKFKKFFGAIFLGQLVSALMYSLAGYFLKDTWSEAIGSVTNSLIALILLITAIYVGYKILSYYKNKLYEGIK